MRIVDRIILASFMLPVMVACAVPETAPSSGPEPVIQVVTATTGVRAAADELVEAAAANRPACVRTLLEQGLDVNVVNHRGLSALHLAVLRGHFAVAQLLLENEASVNQCDDHGLTPLHLAAQYGHVPLIKLLLGYGAEIEAKTYARGLTPLHWAALWGHLESVGALLESGALINARDHTGSTPLTWAEAFGHYPMARLLARRGARRHEHEQVVRGLDGSFHLP